ncbi:MAG: alpha/beta hydrolase [Eubacteriales bacterium]
MIHETIALWDKYPEATLTAYCITSCPELKLEPRRAVVVCPGGGYHFLSAREAEPIVFKFLSAGFNVFLLRYTVEPYAKDYAPLIQAGMAIKYVRENAEKYNTDPDHVFINGFSAGGHLAASAGTLWNSKPVREALGIEAGLVPEGINRPTGTILSYPVITGGDKAHKGSIRNVSGHKELTDADVSEWSLELHVDENTSPAFIWHTFTDKVVPVENSLLYASALAAHKVPFELHVYPEGPHGLSLCNEFTYSKNPEMLVPYAEDWINLAIKWAQTLN